MSPLSPNRTTRHATNFLRAIYLECEWARRLTKPSKEETEHGINGCGGFHACEHRHFDGACNERILLGFIVWADFRGRLAFGCKAVAALFLLRIASLLVADPGDRKATLVMLGELQEASFDERICLIRQRADQSCLLTAKVLVHLPTPGMKRSIVSTPKVAGKVWPGSQSPPGMSGSAPLLAITTR